MWAWFADLSRDHGWGPVLSENEIVGVTAGHVSRC